MNPQTIPVKKGGADEGSSLLEVLVALLIMMFLMVGILEMFSLSYMMGMGAAARTDLTYKCVQVTENIRFFSYLAHEGQTIPSTANFQFKAGTIDLPYTASELSQYKYWGPDESDVVDAPDLPYKLSIEIQDGDALTSTSPGAAGQWIVTVTALPVPRSMQGVRHFIGMGISNKRVDYVVQIPKA